MTFWRASSGMALSIGVSIAPGQTTLTRMPSAARPPAAARVRPSTPAFDAG
jgi:hypothetical protein